MSVPLTAIQPTVAHAWGSYIISGERLVHDIGITGTAATWIDDCPETWMDEYVAHAWHMCEPHAWRMRISHAWDSGQSFEIRCLFHFGSGPIHSGPIRLRSTNSRIPFQQLLSYSPHGGWTDQLRQLSLARALALHLNRTLVS